MSSNNSADCDTESECDYYSDRWEESSYKDLVASDSESDLCQCFHQNLPCSSFKTKKGESKLNETVLISENTPTNFTDCCKNCLLLQVQKLENPRDSQVESSPESLLHFTFKGYQTSDYPPCDGACQDTFCLSSGIPHLIVTEKSVKQPTFHVVKEACVLNKLYQKQTPADYLLTSSHKKSEQVSFPCTETEDSENDAGECFKPSLASTEINKTLVKEPVRFRKYHKCVDSKQKNSSQLLKEHLDDSSETRVKTDHPQTAEHTRSCASSGDIIISLTLEADYPTDSLEGNIISSETEGKEDSKRLIFKFEGPEHNSLFQDLCISLIPNSMHLNAESLKQTTPSTTQVGFPQILVDVANQPLSTQRESSEFTSSDIYPEQVPSIRKLQTSSQTSKHTHVIQYPFFFVRSFPYKVTPTDKIYEVQKNQEKVFRPKKYLVFPKNKQVRKDQKFRNKSYSCSKFHWHTTWDVESMKQNTCNYKAVEELEINELYYVPQTQTSTCCCSPLLDLSVNLNSERSSGTEKLLGVNRKLHKRIGGAKVMPRFSSQYLLNPRSNSEKPQYISPIRKKINLKMQNILNYCLGRTGGQNRHASCKEQVCPIVYNSDTSGNGLFTPHLSNDVNSTASLVSSSRNSPVPLPSAAPVPNERRYSPVPWSPAALYSLPNERWQPPASCLQTESDTYPVALYSFPNERRHSPAPCLQSVRENWHYPDGKGTASYSPCANIVNVVQPPKERNMFKVEEVDSEAAQMVCGHLALKKLLACPCGNMPQYGLFPNGDISQSVSTKTRKSPDINQRTRQTKSDAVNYPSGTCNTMETCCSKCHHLSPSHSLCNIHRQETLRSQFTKAQSYFEDGFPVKNLKEDPVQRSKAVKTHERKNVRIHAGPGAAQQTGPSSPSNDGYNVPQCAVYEPKCYSCRPTIVKQYCGTLREESTSFSSKHKLLENCLNGQGFLAESCKGARTWCTCSHETPLFCMKQTDIYERNRAVPPKRMDSENTQDSPQIHHDQEGHNISHQRCQDKVQYSRLQ